MKDLPLSPTRLVKTTMPSSCPLSRHNIARTYPETRLLSSRSGPVHEMTDQFLESFCSLSRKMGCKDFQLLLVLLGHSSARVPYSTLPHSRERSSTQQGGVGSQVDSPFLPPDAVTLALKPDPESRLSSGRLRGTDQVLF